MMLFILLGGIPFFFLGLVFVFIGARHILSSREMVVSKVETGLGSRKVTLSATGRRMSVGKLAASADAAMKAGRPMDAIHYLHMLESSPKLKEGDLINVLESLGKSYAHIGDYGNAAEYLKRAATALPQRADLHAILAVVYAQLGMSHDAEDSLQKAVTLNSNHPVVMEARTRIASLRKAQENRNALAT
jgi:Flp pilus assembly protein TadD